MGSRSSDRRCCAVRSVRLEVQPTATTTSHRGCCSDQAVAQRAPTAREDEWQAQTDKRRRKMAPARRPWHRAATADQTDGTKAPDRVAQMRRRDASHPGCESASETSPKEAVRGSESGADRAAPSAWRSPARARPTRRQQRRLRRKVWTWLSMLARQWRRKLSGLVHNLQRMGMDLWAALFPWAGCARWEPKGRRSGRSLDGKARWEVA